VQGLDSTVNVQIVSVSLGLTVQRVSLYCKFEVCYILVGFDSEGLQILM
jgi:hypothetical protein